MNNEEPSFEYLKNLKLSATEKDVARGRLRARMGAAQQKPLPSPFFPFTLPFMRYASVGLLALFFVGAGISAAAANALPGDAFYRLKLNTLEPIASATAVGVSKKAAREVALVERRLRELAEVSVRAAAEEKDVKAALDSLGDHLDQAHAHIDTLATSGETADALVTASMLESSLSAHVVILSKVDSARYEEASTTQRVAADKAREGLMASEADVAALTAELLGAIPTPSTQKATSIVEEKVAESVEEVQEAVEKKSASLDEDDYAAIGTVLSDVQVLVSAAEVEKAEGDGKGALILYAQAGKKIEALEMLLEAEVELGVDLFSATSTPEE